MQKHDFHKYGKTAIAAELAAIQELEQRIDDTFALACEHLLQCKGRIAVTGMGKSGHIARKIAATFASTGTPAFFVHPGEASHGDVGMILKTDLVLAISYTGNTQEIITLLPFIKRLGIQLISITGNPKSVLAEHANINLDASIAKEACPLNLAPTASTTAALVLGDALAIALLHARGFTKEDFAKSHPGGSLGKRLLLHIDDIMLTGIAIPKVYDDACVKDALLEMSAKGLGMTAAVNQNEEVVGIFTDGDLRRAFDKNIDINTTSIQTVMTKNCTTAKKGMLATEALQLMETRSFNGLLVVDENNKLIGAFNIHTLLRAGIL
ncbi:MAG: KpsF/GutQ family sugar-phosphate isomerase [Gammaproteobacteria bacterium]|nr:KpsF/GutQ family sugar-phosphate isomerase [Gammaproteobacteria bacterium]